MAIKNITLDNKTFDINYEILNPQNQTTIVFLHGWGSNKEVMKTAFKETLKDFKHIYIDMPGFGKSTNEYVLTTKNYKDIVEIFLTSLSLQANDLIIAGHSFGGKVATLLKPSHLVLLSSAGILEEKSNKVKAKIKLAKIANKVGFSFFSKLFRSKDVDKMTENMYSTFKNVVDEDFRDEFLNYTKDATIFWGKDDTATSLQSGKTIHQLIKNSKFYDFEGGHYFFLKHSKEIEKIILKTIKGD
jgi:pimeloyl-ACP methyl ester carboxylesterase